MKLRLPHKFQAALMAALASVSFTTLSTGSAYGTELTQVVTMSDMITTATVKTATKSTLWEITGEKGTSVVYDFNGSSYLGGITNPDLLTAMQGDQYVTVAAWINVSGTHNNGSVFGYGANGNGVKLIDEGGHLKFTTKSSADFPASGEGAGTLSTDAWELVAVTFHKISDTQIQIKYILNDTVDGYYTRAGMNGANPDSFAIGSGDSNTTRELFNGSIGGLTVYTSNDWVTASDVSTAMFAAPTLITFARQTWAGDATHNNWTDTVWLNEGSEEPVAFGGEAAVFGADGNKTVLVNSAITAHDVTVSGQAYTFSLENGGSLTADSINVTDHSLTVGDAGKVSVGSYSVGAGASLILRGTASVGQGMNLGSGAHLVLGDGITISVAPVTDGVTAILDVEAGATATWSAAAYVSTRGQGFSQVNVGEGATFKVSSGDQRGNVFERGYETDTIVFEVASGATLEAVNTIVGWENQQGSKYAKQIFNIHNGATYQLDSGSHYLSETTIMLDGGTLNLQSGATINFERRANNVIGTTATAQKMSTVTGAGTINMGNNAGETNKGNDYSGYEFQVNRGAFTLDATNTADMQINVAVSGNHAFLKTGSGTLELTQANGNYSQNFNVYEGTLKLSGDGKPGTGRVNLNTGTTLLLSHAGAITLSNVVAGQGGITKDGAGTVTLSGANTYTGATLVSTGTLVADNASGLGNGSAVTVAAGATLDLNTALTVGSLTLNGGETAESGGILKFMAPASLTVAGNLTFSAGAVLDVANIEYSTGAVTLATVSGTISSVEGVKLVNVQGGYDDNKLVLGDDGHTLLLQFGMPEELLVWDNHMEMGLWSSDSMIGASWHNVSTPEEHVPYPADKAANVRFTAACQDSATLGEDIAVDVLNVDSSATATIHTGGASAPYTLEVASVAGSGATLKLQGAGTTDVAGNTHLDTLIVGDPAHREENTIVNLADSTITTLTNECGTVTVAGASSITTLNAKGGTTAIKGTDADHKATVGTLNVAQGATAEFTYTDFNFSNDDRSIKGNVTIGSGATGTVAGNSDGLNYDGSVTITVDGGTLVMNHRWTVGGSNTIVLKNGTVTGTGESGASAFDPIRSNNFIVSSGTSSIAAPIRLRNAAVGFQVDNGTLTISGNISEGDGNPQGLVKSGAGSLNLTGTLGYNGNTVVNAGSLTTSSTFSISKANQLQVKSDATATFGGTVNIGNGASFSVAEGGTLTFGGTVAVTTTNPGQEITRPEAGQNGFNTISNSATVGTGATGGTWTLNGYAAIYNATAGTVAFENQVGTIYYIQKAGTQGSTIPSENITKVVVDTHDMDTPVELGNTAYTAFSTLQIDSGVVTTTHHSGEGVVKNGDIIINAGGTFRVAGQHDAFGYNNPTRSITLNGAEGNLATLDLRQTTENSVTMKTNLILNGHTRITDNGTYNKGFNTFDCSITVAGVDNQIDHIDIRENATVTVENNAALSIGKVTLSTETSGKVLTKGGAGSLTFTGDAAMYGLNINAGSVSLNGGAEADYSLGAVWISSGSIAIGTDGVKSLTATDLVVRTTSKLSSAAATPTVFNVTNFDVSNYDTNFTLENVSLNVSGAATAAVLNTAQANDQATVTVGDKATLNLNGSVVWRKPDGAKTDYVNLTINQGGAANVNGGTGNILNDVTVNAGGQLNFKSGTTTTVQGALALGGTIDNAGTVNISSGRVAAGQVGTLTGSGTYNLNGTITNNGTLQLADARFNGGAEASITGNVEIHGGLFSGSLTIGSSGTTVSVTKAFTVEDGISLNLGGSDALVLDNLEGVVATYSDGVADPTNNGFLAYLSGTVFHYLGDEEPLQDVTLPRHISYRGNDGMLNYDSDKKTAEFEVGGSKATFYVNTATETEETYSHAKEVGADTFTMVELANGTGFNIDSANAALSRVTVKAGAAASLTIGGTGATIGSVETGNGLSLTGEGTLTFGNAGGDHSLNGAGTLTINGPTVTINGTNNTSFTGNVDVQSGTIKLGESSGSQYVLGAYNFGEGDTRTITIHDGATLDINGKVDNNYVYTMEGGRLTNTGDGLTDGYSQTIGLILNADSYVGGEGSNEFWLRQRNAVSGAPTKLVLDTHNLTKQGNGLFGLFHTTVTGSGYLVVEAGTVKFDGGSFGANLRLAGGNVTGGDGNLNLSANTTIDTTKAGTISAVVTGDGKSVTKTGGATLTVTGANTYSGGTEVQAGTLEVSGNGSLGSGAVAVDKDATLKYNRTTDATVAAELSGEGTLQHTGSGTTNFTGDVSGFTGNVDVDAGTLNIMNIAEATKLNVADVTINNATMGVYNGTTATAETASEGILTIKQGKALTASGNATLNANLVMDSGSTLDVSGTNGLGLAMGSTVTLNPYVTLSAGDMAAITDLDFMDQYTLFTGVDAFSYDGSNPSAAPIAFDSETWVKASQVFSNSEFTGDKEYYVFYSGAQNGSNVGAIYIMQMPEPTTGTLSLLALAALAARRRRK